MYDSIYRGDRCRRRLGIVIVFHSGKYGMKPDLGRDRKKCVRIEKRRFLFLFTKPGLCA